ncbi:PAS domain-containing protein [Niabella ginsengisoli]|uniref:PAS domain-containing protein n=1 Tax=Niabella ginsengisoli TaxID=522298 RepID=UPI0021D43E7A|nr:PAS domain S-box protein [Niabella ginsengisoli]
MKNHIVDSATDSILGISLTGKVLYANHAAIALFQDSDQPDSLQGRSFISLLAPEYKDAFEVSLERLKFNEHLEIVKSEIVTFSDIKKSVFIQYSSILDENGRIIGVSAVLRLASQTYKVASKAQALLETAPDAMVIVNKQGQIVLANAQTESLFGYTKDELLGQEVEVLIPDSFLKYHKSHRETYFKQPTTRSMGKGIELYAKRKDSSTFQAEISLSPLITEEGTFVSAAIRDITERKRGEQMFRGLLESAPDAMVIVSKDGIIQLVNTQVENIFGYNKSELIGKRVEILIPDRFRGNHTSHRDGFFQTPKPAQWELG